MRSRIVQLMMLAVSVVVASSCTDGEATDDTARSSQLYIARFEEHVRKLESDICAQSRLEREGVLSGRWDEGTEEAAVHAMERMFTDGAYELDKLSPGERGEEHDAVVHALRDMAAGQRERDAEAINASSRDLRTSIDAWIAATGHALPGEGGGPFPVFRSCSQDPPSSERSDSEPGLPPIAPIDDPTGRTSPERSNSEPELATIAPIDNSTGR